MENSIKLPRNVQGRCGGCNVAYRWPETEGKLSNAYCPECWDRLKVIETTFQGTWKNETPTIWTVKDILDREG